VLDVAGERERKSAVWAQETRRRHRSAIVVSTIPTLDEPAV
jgi:hypothetical protein